MAKFPRREFIVLTAPVGVFVAVVFGLLNRQPQFAIERIKIVPLSPPSGKRNPIWEPDTQVTVYLRHYPTSLQAYGRHWLYGGSITTYAGHKVMGLFDATGRRLPARVTVGMSDGLDGPIHYALEYEFDLSKVPQSVKVVKLQTQLQLEGLSLPVMVVVRNGNKQS